MSAARRTALVQWARSRQAIIIEDDYDGEFRYDRQPVGALQQLDPGHVIYVGTASKTLAPGLRLGWLSAPPPISRTLAAAKKQLDRGTSILEQLTLAEMMTSGAFDRHVRRMRASYHHRRDELTQALTAALPGLHLAGTSAGLHALICLPASGPTGKQLQAQGARHSVAFHILADYWLHPPAPSPQAIIIGYASPAGHAYRPALQALTRLLAGDPPD
jgi:GntR family transcriptional regulator/MocR family aminotransferase